MALRLANTKAAGRALCMDACSCPSVEKEPRDTQVVKKQSQPLRSRALPPGSGSDGSNKSHAWPFEHGDTEQSPQKTAWTGWDRTCPQPCAKLTAVLALPRGGVPAAAVAWALGAFRAGPLTLPSGSALDMYVYN